MNRPPIYRKSSFLLQITPVMLCFFVMGFVDLVGTASNYVQQDLLLTDGQANLLPSLVFFWFLICSVPTGLLMNRIGRKRTVLVSLLVTAVALLIPIFGSSYWVMFAAFSCLGIGNAIMQTSLNPLISNLISSDKLTSTLTFGQFVKAIASFLAPVIAAWGATVVGYTFGLGWRVLFVIYATICILSIFLLAITPIVEEEPAEASSMGACFKLLGTPFILLCFLGIMCHVGIDVGTNTIAPKILMERLGLPLERAGLATSVYFVFRTAGCLLGAFALRRVSSKPFLIISVCMILCGMAMLLLCEGLMALYIGIALVGLGNSNVFSIIFSNALLYLPSKQNEVSGLMIMGLFGGTIFPLAMGYAADAFGQIGAVAIMTVGTLYLLIYATKIKKL